MYPRDRAPPPPSLCKPEAPYLSPLPHSTGPCCGRWPQWLPDPLVPPGGAPPPSRGARQGRFPPALRRDDRRASTTRPILRAACAGQAEPSSPDDGQDHHEVFRPEGSLSGRGRVARWRDPQGRREAFLYGEPPLGPGGKRSVSAPAVRTANSQLRGERRSHCQVFHA